MSEITDILGLPLLQAAQAQKHITHNEALLALDAIVQLVVIDRDRALPPALPVAGDRHVVAAPASGAWANHEQEIAVFIDGVWDFIEPRAGWRAYILTETQEAVFDGVIWKAASERSAQVARLGIGTVADATNRLSVASEAVLLNHAGAGLQLKLNKALSGDTASLLYQTGFHGHAELGLSGDNEFSLKTSADGLAWQIALKSVAATGRVDFPQGASRGGIELLARDMILGEVAQTNGQPSGTILEAGSTAHGAYLCLADGTQICWKNGLSFGAVTLPLGQGFASSPQNWTFPKAFIAPPTVTASAERLGLWASAAAPDSSAVTLRLLGFQSEAVAATGMVQAVGRWF